MFYILKEKEICPAYISKFNSNCEKQVNLLMIPNKEKESLHYLKCSALLHRITSKHKCDFHCLNSFHSFRTEHKLKSLEKVCENKGFWGLVMPSKKDNILNLIKCEVR